MLLVVVVAAVALLLFRMRRPRPDSPQSFGYKCAWLAIRGAAPEAVANALELQRVAVSNWQRGVRAAYEGRVFVTPAVGGWVLVASTALPDTGDADRVDEATPWLRKLGKVFPEVQYFATHRVVELHAWARVVHGTFARKFAYLGEQGAVIWNDGPVTSVEQKLGLDFSAPSEDWQRFPDEDDVMAIARDWGIDPSTLESQSFGPGLGLVGVRTRWR